MTFFVIILCMVIHGSVSNSATLTDSDWKKIIDSQNNQGDIFHYDHVFVHSCIVSVIGLSVCIILIVYGVYWWKKYRINEAIKESTNEMNKQCQGDLELAQLTNEPLNMKTVCKWDFVNGKKK